MEINFSATPTADLRELDRIGTKITDFLLARLKKRHPHSMHELFPSATCPVPDFEFAETYGPATLADVRDVAEAACTAILARTELELRRYPN